MSRLFLLRIALDGLTAGLFLFGLAYWWLGNVAHELAGTLMFLLIFSHVFFNRRWVGSVPRIGRRALGAFDIAVIALLAIAMLALLVTSVMISETLGRILSLSPGFTARQVHTLAAYWVLIIVGVHLGLRWPVVMTFFRKLAGLERPRNARTLVLRVAAAAIIVLGVASWLVLDVGSRLSMTVTLDWWNFDEGASGFFIYCGGVVGVCAVLTYYVTRGLHVLQGGTKSRKSISVR